MGNFISYYNNYTMAQQELDNYHQFSDSENQTDEVNIVEHVNTIQQQEQLLLPQQQRVFKYYNLSIYVDSQSLELKNLYIDAANKHNLIVDNYLNALYTSETSMAEYCFDAGFDLFCPEDTESFGSQKVILDHKVKCCMRVVGDNNQFVSYYLYSRSSLPLHTPLRLANNVGIIDSGYRGNIKGVFDNIQGYDFMDFTIEFASRLLQICPPNLEYPMKITIVNDILNLGLTNRGENGFGSTGN